VTDTPLQVPAAEVLSGRSLEGDRVVEGARQNMLGAGSVGGVRLAPQLAFRPNAASIGPDWHDTRGNLHGSEMEDTKAASHVATSLSRLIAADLRHRAAPRTYGEDVLCGLLWIWAETIIARGTGPHHQYEENQAPDEWDKADEEEPSRKVTIVEAANGHRNLG